MICLGARRHRQPRDERTWLSGDGGLTTIGGIVFAKQ
jgi:hypothetical protein